jgi:hypothetical protein
MAILYHLVDYTSTLGFNRYCDRGYSCFQATPIIAMTQMTFVKCAHHAPTVLQARADKICELSACRYDIKWPMR